MKSTEELVTELADREAIRELPVRYCDCVWQNTLDAMIDLFAKDGLLIRPQFAKDGLPIRPTSELPLHSGGFRRLHPPYIAT